jgi:hypothetical protein
MPTSYITERTVVCNGQSYVSEAEDCKTELKQMCGSDGVEKKWVEIYNGKHFVKGPFERRRRRSKNQL